MNKLFYITLFSICWLASDECFAANSGQVDVIQLTKAEDVRDAATMNKAIDTMSVKVKECVRGKLAPASECFCLYPNELSHIRKTYEDTLRQHPNWKGKAVSYVQDDRTLVVSFSGVERQLERKCQ